MTTDTVRHFCRRTGLAVFPAWYLSPMHDEGDGVETVDETLNAGSARLEASRRLLDDIERRLSRGSRLLGRDRDRDDSRPSE